MSMQYLIVRLALTAWGWERTAAINAFRSERHAIFPLKTRPFSPLSVIISFIAASSRKATAVVTSVYVHSRWLAMPERTEKSARALSVLFFFLSNIHLIHRLNLVGTVNEKMKTRPFIYIYIYLCTLLRQILYHDRSLSELLHNG